MGCLVTSSRYSVVVSSCDHYCDAWPPLFALLRRYWPSIPTPVILNTETAEFSCAEIGVLCPRLYMAHSHPALVPWSKRLRECLQATVRTDLVLLFLDDFFLRGPVRTDRLETCVELMSREPRIANILLYSCPPPFTPVADKPWLVKRSKRAPYLFSLQTGLWRTEHLLHLLRDHESPWYFERWGSIRGRLSKLVFYASRTL